MMSVLSTLKLSTSKKAGAMNPLAMRRNKLVKKIGEQISLAKAHSEGVLFTTTKFRTVTDEDGSRRSVELRQKVRQWWWAIEGGKLALNVRYGARAIEFSKGKSTVEIASSSDLIPTLETILKAVEAGELDQQIEVASIKLREGFGK
jgi:hypothetical protein